MVQEILVFITVSFAVGYLIKKFFFKKKSSNSCGSDNCGCG
ncbi:MAG: FeoB-associated Cys-rich membrane protein, partial [Psychroflexus sp.]|jgi:uncharacterized membrane protein YwzB|nr:FeoB-associated Cys-rich membrane protein [Psychroflexus sp.]MDR9449466.1 FeoB-associated Cys-rich membrane protein [Psychroflexus sp.]